MILQETEIDNFLLCSWQEIFFNGKGENWKKKSLEDGEIYLGHGRSILPGLYFETCSLESELKNLISLLNKVFFNLLSLRCL